MRIFILLPLAALFFASCNNNAKGKTFCDTTCKSDPIKFTGDDQFNQSLQINIKNCNPDTVSWTHKGMYISRQIVLPSYVDQDVKLNASMVACAFQDTSIAWLTFNDCLTGRGYMLKLPFSKSNSIQKISGALNSFDPKFSVDKDLRAYTDRGNIYVVDVTNGKQAQMTFKEEYPIEFNKIHEVLDSINVTKERVYVKLLKEGKEIPFEKKITLEEKK
jgi:hypothetical protein